MKYGVIFLIFIILSLSFDLISDGYDSELQNLKLSNSIRDYYSKNPNLERYVDKIVSEMTDEELAGQILMPAWERHVSKDTLEYWICKKKIGGFMILRDKISPKTINSLQKLAKDCGHKTQLFVSIDAEPTLIHIGARVKELKNIPPASQLKTKRDVHNTASKIHTYLNKLGANMNFAPLVDNNKNKVVIGNRSFDANSEKIRILADAFIDNAINHNIIPSVKHFPGHGEAHGDTHKSLQVIPGTLKEIKNFQPLEKNKWKTPLIMVGHLVINGGEFDTNGLPATLSKVAMTNLLHKKLKFNGLVITDAMNMGAVSKFKNTSIRAIEAGADIVLMPENTNIAHREILKKLQTDAEFKKKIIKSVRKIIKLKTAQSWAKDL